MRADDEIIENHLDRLQEYIGIWSISPEIHNGEIERSAELVLEHGIQHIVFWVETTIDGIAKPVTQEDIARVLNLERYYPSIQVYFDMDPQLLEVN